MARVKQFDKTSGIDLSQYSNFSNSGSIIGMKKYHYGKDALLVRSAGYIYNVSSTPDVYHINSY